MTCRRMAQLAGPLIVLLLGFVLMHVPDAGAAPDTERRIALVIGIGAYQNAPHLANPV